MIDKQQLYMQIKKKWTSLYPAYFDSSKSIAEGRRLPKNLCIENPTMQELVRALNFIMLRVFVETDKAYPRDWTNRGRLKVQLVDDKKNPIYPHIPNKQKLMKEIGQKLTQMRKK